MNLGGLFKKLSLIIVAISAFIMLTGCQELENLSARLDQSFVDGVMENLNIHHYIEEAIPSGSNIYLYNMDDPSGDSWATFLDSKLADQLASSNYTLLERDPKQIEKILQERTNKSYSVYYEESKLTQLINNINISTFDVKDLLNAQIMDFMEQDRNSIYLVPTHLKPAEYMISYRILEAKLNYSYHEPPWLVSFYNNTFGAFGDFVNSAVKEIDHNINIDRKGTLKLQIKIENTKTGEILYAKNIESFYKDTFKGDNRLAYEDFSYSFIAPMKKKTIMEKGQSILSIGYKLKGIQDHLLHINYDSISNVWFSVFYDQDFLNNLTYVGLKYGVPLKAGATSAFIPFVGIVHSDKAVLKYGFDIYFRMFDSFQIGYTVENDQNGDILTNSDKSITVKMLLE